MEEGCVFIKFFLPVPALLLVELEQAKRVAKQLINSLYISMYDKSDRHVWSNESLGRNCYYKPYECYTLSWTRYSGISMRWLFR